MATYLERLKKEYGLGDKDKAPASGKSTSPTPTPPPSAGLPMQAPAGTSVAPRAPQGQMATSTGSAVRGQARSTTVAPQAAPTGRGESGEQGVLSYLMDNPALVGMFVNDPVGTGIRMARANAATPDDSSAPGAAALSAGDSATLGMLDNLAGGQAVIDDLASGKTKVTDLEKMHDTYNREKQQMNDGMALIAEDRPTANFLGAMGGSALPGAMLFKGVDKAMSLGKAVGKTPFWRTFIAAPAVASGTETAIYTANSDGTLEEVVGNTAIATLGGAALGSLFAVGGFGKSLIFGRSNNKIKQELGLEMYRTLNKHIRETTGRADDVPVDELVGIIDRMGGDKIVADVYPELQKVMNKYASVDDPKAYENFLNLLATRNDSAMSFRDDILKAATAGTTPRSSKLFNTDMRSLQDDLIPQYNDIFKAQPNAIVDAEVAKKAISKVVDVRGKRGRKDLAMIKKKRIDDFFGQTRKGQPVTVGGNKVRRKYKAANMRELHEFKIELQEEIGRRINSKKNAPITHLQAGVDYANNILRKNDAYLDLNDKYGDLAGSKLAHKIGYDLIGKRTLDGSDVQDWLGKKTRSSNEMKAFVEGARRRLYDDARNASDATPESIAKAVTKSNKLEDVAAIMGKDAADQMAESIGDVINREASRRSVSQGLDNLTMPKEGGTATQNILDVRVGMAPFMGEGGGVAPEFARRRISEIAAGTRPAVAAESKQAAGLASEMLTDNSKFSQALQKLKGPTTQDAAMAVGGAATAGEMTQQMPEGAGQNTGEALLNYFPEMSRYLFGGSNQ